MECFVLTHLMRFYIIVFLFLFPVLMKVVLMISSPALESSLRIASCPLCLLELSVFRVRIKK